MADKWNENDVDFIRGRALPTSVYFIGDGEAIKIGIASRPERRLADMQTGNAKKLKMYFCINAGISAATLEKKLHRFFNNYHIRGEWYEQKPVLDWLEKVSENYIREETNNG